MNNFTTDERIEQFSNLMNPYVAAAHSAYG